MTWHCSYISSVALILWRLIGAIIFDVYIYIFDVTIGTSSHLIVKNRFVGKTLFVKRVEGVVNVRGIEARF